MFKVYQRLSKENPKSSITAYLLDNGSYNLPIWNKDKKITSGEIKEHLGRNYDGGTALVLIDDGAISPYEYVNKYKEIQHYTNNFTRDAKTQKPIVNEKSVIVIHHTGNYDDPNKIIREFEGAKETSSHVLIMKDGSRHIFNNDNYVLAHAGKSDFNNRNAVNYFSIGIELEGDTKNGHQFTIAQLESLLEYIHPRIEKYGISLENITTHKIIRDNYIKKHPGENIPKKQDLDDKVWKQIHDLIAQKLYKEKITAKQ
ncbi:N-acetylmuramoyl-L-alanine amidase [Candidatus Nomurabacteria bacterium]|nr:N-acetylmuramoyl-L-alanine amidase [Candidatus Nomurabacteria bacterium]